MNTITYIQGVQLLTLRSVRRLLFRASVVPSSPILVTLMKEALNSPETPVLTRSTRRNIPKDVIFRTQYIYQSMGLSLKQIFSLK
jgi:hypothetical protein